MNGSKRSFGIGPTTSGKMNGNKVNRKELHKKAMLVTGPLMKEKGYISYVDM